MALVIPTEDVIIRVEESLRINVRDPSAAPRLRGFGRDDM